MIWKIWSFLMVILVGGVWLLAIPYSPQPILETGSVIHLYRQMGMVPEAGEITFSKEIDHDVFEVPDQDATELKMAMASMNMEGMAGMEGMSGMDMKQDADHSGEEMQGMAGMDMNKEDDHGGDEMKPMAGMDMKQDSDHAGEVAEGMSGMDMDKEDDHGADEMKPMAGMDMKQDADHAGEVVEGMSNMEMDKEDGHAADEMKPMAGMDMKQDADHPGEEMQGMAGMDMNKADDHAGEGNKEMAMTKDGHGNESEEEEGGHGGGSEAEGLMVLVQGTAAEVDREIEHDGISIDSSAVIDLKEWSVGSGMTMAQAGQTVRLTVKNSGNIPHEFMLMNGAAMQAVNYRLNRPDWNLLEHRATMEIPFLMPGDTTDVVVKITRSGMWMYMCMFPYHMQLGMMGMLMTPDMMGKMDMNMEMDLFMPDS